MLDCLQKSWRKDRYKVTFSGFLTKKRLRFIKQLIETRTSFKKTFFLIMCQIILSIPNKLAFRLRYSYSLKISKMEILFTNKERIFPVKAWDQEYFNQLLESKFVFCPDGDFVWTYRFFESIICGAIPVVENHCVPYNGFKYLTLEQYLNGETLTDSDLISNFLKIKKEFTLRPF